MRAHLNHCQTLSCYYLNIQLASIYWMLTVLYILHVSAHASRCVSARASCEMYDLHTRANSRGIYAKTSYSRNGSFCMYSLKARSFCTRRGFVLRRYNFYIPRRYRWTPFFRCMQLPCSLMAFLYSIRLVPMQLSEHSRSLYIHRDMASLSPDRPRRHAIVSENTNP